MRQTCQMGKRDKTPKSWTFKAIVSDEDNWEKYQAMYAGRCSPGNAGDNSTKGTSAIYVESGAKRTSFRQSIREFPVYSEVIDDFCGIVRRARLFHRCSEGSIRQAHAKRSKNADHYKTQPEINGSAAHQVGIFQNHLPQTIHNIGGGVET